MIKFFTKYVSIGVINTAIHWAVFGLVYWMYPDQSICNLAGFMVAVTFSFYANARWTFESHATPLRYFSMVGFMAVLSWSTGKLADAVSLPPIATLVLFSGISLVVGFFFTKFFVFRNAK
jgi:putative flippase GtrA